MKRFRLLALALGILCIPLVAMVSADEFRAEARVDREVVGVGGRLILTIEVFGPGQVSGPDMEGIEGFRIVNTSRSQTLSIVNFDAVRSLTLQYVLVAEAEGEYVMGPFTLQSGNEIVETETLNVRVVKGQAPPPSAQPEQRGDDDTMLMRASVDKTRAYVGEQITYNLQFAYRVRPRELQYNPPDHSGFWTEEMGETGPTIETIDGRQYYVVNRRTAFFPISGGRFTIGEASARYVVGGRSPFSFDPFSMSRGREGSVATEPVDIVVRQLPTEGRPVDFGGAVGRFRLQVSPSVREVKAGESLTLSVRISGRGNVKSIGDITIPDIDGFRVFAPKARESKNVEGLEVGGEKVFELVLVPERPGDQVIPEFEFSYFDPGKETYVTLRSAPVTIGVLPGDVASLSGGSGAPAGLQGARRDIRHIKRVRISRDSLAVSSEGLQGFLMMYVPAIVGIVGFIVSVQRRRALVSGKGAARRAYGAAMHDLREASKTASGSQGAAEAAGSAAKAVRAYLAVLAGTSEALVDRTSISSMAGIGDATKHEIADLLDALDRIRFSPVGADAVQVRDLIGRADDLLRAARKEWK